MKKFLSFIGANPTSGFIILTFLVSSISFIFMLKIPAAQSPESVKGFPVWLVAIWSPNLAAVIVWMIQKKVISSIRISFSIPQYSSWMLIAFIPLIIAGALIVIEVLNGKEVQFSNFKWSYILPLIFINLIMGPLGEELGWRGFLYPHLKSRYGWMAAAIIVGIIWSVWHAPLWFLDSPQSKIPFWAFCSNVILLSILMSMIYNYSNGSIIWVILLHLTFNVSLGVIDIIELHNSGEFVVRGLYFYVPIVLILVGIHELIKTNNCLLLSN